MSQQPSGESMEDLKNRNQLAYEDTCRLERQNASLEKRLTEKDAEIARLNKVATNYMDEMHRLAGLNEEKNNRLAEKDAEIKQLKEYKSVCTIHGRPSCLYCAADCSNAEKRLAVARTALEKYAKITDDALEVMPIADVQHWAKEALVEIDKEADHE